MIVLPAADSSRAKAIAERLREKIEETGLMTNEYGLVFCTISLGISDLTEEITTIEELIIQADKALYRAKEQGENRVEIFTGE